MADVFVSYKREDRDKVQHIVDLIIGAGLSVWWDRRIKGGEIWNSRIRREIRDARCVVVAWSIRSIQPTAKFVHAEAMEAFANDRLIGVRIEPVGIPLPFGAVQSVDFFGSDATAGHVLIDAVRSRIAARRKPQGTPPWKRWRTIDLVCEATGLQVRIDIDALRNGRSLRLGRDTACDVVIRDPEKIVSREHARITLLKGRGPCISDNKSSNGTYLDDREVKSKPMPLLRASRLKLGARSFLVKPS